MLYKRLTHFSVNINTLSLMSVKNQSSKQLIVDFKASVSSSQAGCQKSLTWSRQESQAVIYTVRVKIIAVPKTYKVYL